MWAGGLGCWSRAVLRQDSDVEAESVKMTPGGAALNQGRPSYSGFRELIFVRQLHALGLKVHFLGAAGRMPHVSMRKCSAGGSRCHGA